MGESVRRIRWLAVLFRQQTGLVCRDRTVRTGFLPALGLAFALALGPGGAARAAGGGGDLAISNGWMRIVIPERPAAGYFTLKNDGAEPRELVGAASPDCGMVMLHRSLSKSGVETMDMVDDVTIPAHGSVSFAPGGYHLMCMQPSAAMKPGASIPMTLHFKDGTSLKAEFAVRNAMGRNATGK